MIMTDFHIDYTILPIFLNQICTREWSNLQEKTNRKRTKKNLLIADRCEVNQTLQLTSMKTTHRYFWQKNFNYLAHEWILERVIPAYLIFQFHVEAFSAFTIGSFSPWNNLNLFNLSKTSLTINKESVRNENIVRKN